MHTQNDLLADAALIRDETVLLANTATRVGTMHQSTVEALFEQITYLDTTPVAVAAGAIAAGDNLAGRTVLSIMRDIFRAPFRGAAVSLTGDGILEKGLVGGASMFVSGSITPNDDTIAARRLRRTVGGVTTTITVPAGNSVAFTDAGLSANASYVLEADTAANGTKRSGAVGVALVAPSYYGIVALVPSEAEVKALTRQLWTGAARALTYTNNNQRVGFFEPSVLGRRTLIRNQNGYDVTATFSYSAVNFTLPDGSVEPYGCYVLSDPAGDGTPFTYTFSF